MCVCLSVSLCVRLRVHGSVGVGDVLVQWSRNVSLPTVGTYVRTYICMYVCTVGVVLCCVVLTKELACFSWC